MLDNLTQTILGFVISPQDLAARITVEFLLTFVAILQLWLVSRKLGKDRRRGRLQFTSMTWWLKLIKNMYKRVVLGKSKPILDGYSRGVIPQADPNMVAYDMESAADSITRRKTK